MTLTAEADERRPHEQQDHRTARLREVEHWRRLVAARLDLMVATITSVAEPEMHLAWTPGTPVLPSGLRHLIGLDGDPLLAVAALEPLRSTLAALEACARGLRADLGMPEVEPEAARPV